MSDRTGSVDESSVFESSSKSCGAPGDKPDPNAASGYAQILKASSIIGGSQFVQIVAGTLRNKVVALLLGPIGVGEIGLLLTAQQLITTATGFGIRTSAVREIAEAHSAAGPDVVAKKVIALRWLCFVTGLVGAFTTVLLSPWISQWSFGDSNHTGVIASLGCAVFFVQLTVANTAQLQATERIVEFAWQAIVGAIAALVLSTGIFYVMRHEGIAPVIIATSMCAFGVTYYFTKGSIAQTSITTGELLEFAKSYVALGVAFLYAGIIAAFANWFIQSSVTRTFGSEGNGVYNAAWSLSAQFAGFILGAMGTDFYPRLARLANDHVALNRLVNDQTEIGVLLALPGLTFTLAFAPYAVVLLYSSQFHGAANLLPWFVLGIFGRVVSWPLGYVQMALGRGRLFAATESAFWGAYIVVSYLLMATGMVGVAVAFAISYVLYTVAMMGVAAWLTGFRWSRNVKQLLRTSTALILASFLVASVLNSLFTALCVGLIAMATSIYSVRELAVRLGPSHRITRTASRIPFLLPTEG